MHPIDTTDAAAALALSFEGMHAFLRDGLTRLHLFGDAQNPSVIIARPTGMIVLHQADARAPSDLMRSRTPVGKLMYRFDDLCTAFAAFAFDAHMRPIIKAHGTTPLARRELAKLDIRPLTSAEAQTLRDKLASVTKNSARRRARGGRY